MKIDPTRLLQRVEVASAQQRLGQADLRMLPRPFPYAPVGAESLHEIGHIVVLMMENHSYDNSLGLLERGEGLPKDSEGNPTSTNPSIGGEPFRAHHLRSTGQLRNVPSQSWPASHVQWNGGDNDGFVRSVEHQHGALIRAWPWATGQRPTCPFITPWRGPFLTPTGGFRPVWDPPFPTAGSWSPAPRMA